MKKWTTYEAQRCGWAPKEVDAEVENINDIIKPGVYAVKGEKSPCIVDEVTEYGADSLDGQGYYVERGMVFIFNGVLIDEPAPDIGFEDLDETLTMPSVNTKKNNLLIR